MALYLNSTISFPAALGLSIFLHSLALSLTLINLDPKPNRQQDSQLEIILVNSKSASKPHDAQARAQANLDGGGNVDEERRAKTPLPPIAQINEGDQPAASKPRPREPEKPKQEVMTRKKSDKSVTTESRKTETAEMNAPPVGADLLASAMTIARMEAQVARDIDAYNKRPRKKFFAPRTAEAVEAMYVEGWRQKVERVGNLNYPEAAKGRLYGSLLLTVEIRADGQVESIEITRSSGHKLLDEAARRIVTLAGPYGAFPPDLKKQADIFSITRTWTFATGDTLLADK